MNDQGSSRTRTTGYILLLLTGLLLSACGGGGSNGSTPAAAAPPATTSTPPPEATAPPPALAGDPDALAVTAIEDVYLGHSFESTDISNDAQGIPLVRTEFSIVLLEDATIGEVNDLLDAHSAEIVASLAGFPSLVVRIPDPGSYAELASIIRSVENSNAVSHVVPSRALRTLGLPPNIETLINAEPDPATAPQWNDVDHHLRVRAAAAWVLQTLSRNIQPVVVVLDKFGGGDPDLNVFNVETVPDVTFRADESEFGIKTAGPPDDHGYQMLSSIAAIHDPAGADSPAQRVTGMVPRSIGFVGVDASNITDQSIHTRLMQVLRDLSGLDAFRGTIVVNYSMGFAHGCENLGAEQPCNSRLLMESEVVLFLRMAREIGVEKRILFVTAAGNISRGGSPANEPSDAATNSVINAAALMSGWSDPGAGNLQPLNNVLVVENATGNPTETNRPTLFRPHCVHEGSYVGGGIAGIGMGVYAMTAPSNTAREEADGGSSAAAAQVSGVAAYLASLDPALTPQDMLQILRSTASEMTGTGGDCTPLISPARAVDAYAALLAADYPDPSHPAYARARLQLLDVTGPVVDSEPDTVFDLYDLRRWIGEVANPVFPEGTYDYGRFDLNGDGMTGGPTTASFDLDMSTGPDTPATPAFNPVSFEFLGSEVTYSERSLTDIQIVCYYAMSPLFDLAGSGESARDLELERVADLCGGSTVTVTPASVQLDEGETVQFTASLAGIEDQEVVWSADGGDIDDELGLYTATEPGAFTVTATSVENPQAQGTAQVTVLPDEISGRYEGERMEFDYGEPSGPYRYIFDLNRTGDEFEFYVRGANGTGTDFVYTGQFSGNSFSGRTLDGGYCDVADCPITGTVTQTAEGTVINATAYWQGIGHCVSQRTGLSGCYDVIEATRVE